MTKQLKKNEREFVISQEEKLNQPIIRPIWKKIRNITKKITEIETIEKKVDLKPEQIEKIKNKSNLLDEKKRFQDFLKIYKQILEQNKSEKIDSKINAEEQFQASQNSQIIDFISQIIVISQSTVNKQKITDALGSSNSQNIYQFPPTPRSSMKFDDYLTQISACLNDLVKNTKLNLQKFYEVCPKQTIEWKQVKTQNNLQDQTPKLIQEPPKKTIQAQKIINSENAEAKIQIITQVIDKFQNIKIQPQTIEQPISQAPKEENQIISEIKNQDKVQQQISQAKPVENLEQRKQYTGNNKGYKKYRDNYKQKRQYNNQREEYRPKKYEYKKPKYSEKVVEQKEDTSLSSSEQRQYKKREFNHNQIKELQDQGFVVIKKKQKPKDPKDLQEYHRKQHGFKDKEKDKDHHKE